VGPTFRAILIDQFARTRDGDRLWFENSFSGAELDQLEHVTLSDVIKRDTSLTNVQDNVMFVPAPTLTATGTTLSAVTGQRLLALVGSFADTGGNPGAATDYSAFVYWGDGSPLSTGGISASGAGTYDVAATHTYQAAGSYTATVYVYDNRNPGRLATATTTVEVTDPAAPPGAAGADDSPAQLLDPALLAGFLDADGRHK
jgi:hypothetical protein